MPENRPFCSLKNGDFSLKKTRRWPHFVAVFGDKSPDLVTLVYASNCLNSSMASVNNEQQQQHVIIILAHKPRFFGQTFN